MRQLSSSLLLSRKSIRAGIGAVALAAWLILVIAMCTHHEPWRDEVEALSIATGVGSWWQLPEALRNTGHPILWYLLLRIAFGLFHTTVVLKGLSVTVAFLAVSLFLWRAPFPLWVRVLFIFSFFPLYEYAVLARNYGIGMLLMFAFAAVYPLRKKYPLLLVLILSLLANTTLQSCIATGALALLWFWDEGYGAANSRQAKTFAVLGVCFLLVAFSILGSILCCIPDSGFAPSSALGGPGRGLGGAIAKAALLPGSDLDRILPFPFRNLLVYLLFAGLLIWPPAAVSFFASVFLYGLFFATVYPGGTRHQGLVLMTAITFYWLVRERSGAPPNRGGLGRRLLFVHKAVALFIIPALLMQYLWLSYHPIKADWEREFSSSRALAAFLRSRPDLSEAILLPEPDAYAESLFYYLSVPTYFYRQDAFGTYFLRGNRHRKDASLGELLQVARRLKKETGKPVLILMGSPPLEDVPPWERPNHDDQTFRWTSEELKDFYSSARSLASFQGSILDENYELFLLER